MKLALLFALALGCAHRSGPPHRAEARYSSGSVPCDSTEIEVSDSNYGSTEFKRGSWTWIARCRGEKYFCASQLPPGQGYNQRWLPAQCTAR